MSEATSVPAPATRPGSMLDETPTSGWTAAEKAAFAALAAEERSAAYLNSIRKMLIFFVVITVLGLISGAVFGYMEYNAINTLKQQSTISNPFSAPGQ